MPEEVNDTTAAKAAKKKAPKAVKVKKAPKAKKESTGQRGRSSAYAGKHINKLVDVKDTGIRETGNLRTCWNCIKEGSSVESYRAKAVEAGQHSGHALACLRVFAKKKYVKLV